MLYLLLAATLSLKVMPRLSNCAPNNPSEITVKVVIANPSAEMYCPTYTIFWPGGTKSTHTEDCPPWSELEAGWTPEPFERTMPHCACEDCVVEVVAEQGKRQLRERLTFTVR